MKNKVTFIASVFFISIHLIPHKSIYSQNESDIFNRSVSNIVWLGVDFSKTKYNGSLGTVDKITGTGTMWVTFFRFSDHKILIAERMTGKAGGFGFRNHWANTVYEVLKQIKSSEYNTWKKKYSN